MKIIHKFNKYLVVYSSFIVIINLIHTQYLILIEKVFLKTHGYMNTYDNKLSIEDFNILILNS